MESLRVGTIIQARMGSTRLPGKVLKTVLGKTLLEYQWERVGRSNRLDEIIVATTTNEADHPIVELCEKLCIPVYRGSEEDVLARYYEAATAFKLDVIVRLTSDCPLIDSDVVDKVVEFFISDINKYDYASNTLARTYPRGFDTEVFSYEALTMAYLEAKNVSNREHVTSYFYQHPEKFRLASIEDKDDHSEYRLTVDTMEDFTLIKKIVCILYPQKEFFDLKDIVGVLNENPSWANINKHVEQKII
ncbi:cytidylyltransferase domain-containing protein [Niallia sp. 01092]|uniref:cytidylyltransferase domain-containing protein n=1 Tax=unclassified Niallia TaxID=2837522 RepID=UPI003FD00CB6